MLRVWVDKVRRKGEEKLDQFLVLSSRRRKAKTAVVPYDGTPRITLIAVNFNTLSLSKLMLLTLAGNLDTSKLVRAVIVDNGSVDGSRRFFAKFPRSSKMSYLANSGPATHAHGLRAGIRHVEGLESSLHKQKRTNLYLIVDSDVVFLGSDLLDALCKTLHEQGAGMVGQLQYDVGESYAHPCCLLLRRDVYDDPRTDPFINHGAPALWLQRSMKRCGMTIADFPVRAGHYIVHRGRSTIEAIPRFAPLHSCASVPWRQADFHGDPEGPKLWEIQERKYEELLRPDREDVAIRFIDENL